MNKPIGKFLGLMTLVVLLAINMVRAQSGPVFRIGVLDDERGPKTDPQILQRQIGLEQRTPSLELPGTPQASGHADQPQQQRD